MTKTSLIKVLGIAATVIGIGMDLLNDWVQDKEMEKTIEEKVNEALAKRENKEEES